MAKPLKLAGLRESEALLRRVRRQHSLGRISSLDSNILERKVGEIIKYIQGMEEVDADGKTIADPTAGV